MLRILSWSSGLGCDKAQNSDYDVFMSEQSQSASPGFSLVPSVKRKRSFGSDLLGTDHLSSMIVEAKNDRVQDLSVPSEVLSPDSGVPDVKQEPSSTDEPQQPQSLSTMTSTNPTESSTKHCSKSRLRHMKQTISSQLSLEVLVKHKELRLIDQEIAKCQIALEQIRRCSEIPYPGTQQPSVSVSEGRGSALRRSTERYPAKSPAPWGVTDGPYTRHYAHWLLPDARFDGGEPEIAYIPNVMDSAVPARSTRGSFVESGKTIKSRSTMRASGNFQSLPAGYGQPKEKATGPMILKRKSDNSMVKLVCPDCGRHDFGSAQGFINHCRIGHGRSFASHDAAAEACGEPVEYNENGTIKGVEAVVTPTSTNMHPLIRSAKLMSHAGASTPLPTSASDPKSNQRKPPKPIVTSPSFLSSGETPHLSALVQRKGIGLDLQALVEDAKTKTEVPEMENDDEEMEMDAPLPTTFGRHPQVAGSKQPVMSASSKQPSPLLHSRMTFNRNPMPDVPKTSDNRAGANTSGPESGHDFMRNLLPSPTNESTQAPSLVDDDEEFDPQSPPSSDEIDEAEVDFEVHDEDHGERAVLRGGDLPSPQATCNPTSSARNHARRPSTVRKSLGSTIENKAVLVASPSPHPEGSDRKRRKLEEN